MRVLVTGVAGQLGHDVMNELNRRGYEGIGTDLADQYAGVRDGSAAERMEYIQLDITNQDAVSAVFEKVRPDAVIHCAAWTAVDLAEDRELLGKVQAVNAGGTEHIARAALGVDAKMLYLSTDYVFDGMGDRPWDPDDKNYSPLNVYGQTKLDGELAVSGILEKYFIVRIAWVFGKSGSNYIRTMLSIGRKHHQLRIVNDQIGTPTYTYDLSSLLVDMIETDRYGYYHATNSELSDAQGPFDSDGTKTGYISWYDFSREIFRQASAMGYTDYDEENLKLIPVSTKEYGLSRAKRPSNSRLDKSKLVREGFRPLPDWKDALSRYLKEIDF